MGVAGDKLDALLGKLRAGADGPGAAAVATHTGTSRAVAHKPGGDRQPELRIENEPDRRPVRKTGQPAGQLGSSLMAVPTPIRITSERARSAWTC
jgi:hypothetical protein